MEPKILAILIAASAAFGAFLVYFFFVRERNEDLIIHLGTQKDLALEGCGRDVSHIFTLKDAKRITKSNELFESAELVVKDMESECETLQNSINEQINEITKIEKRIQDQSTKGKQGVAIQAHLTPALNRLTDSMMDMSASINELSFASAKRRFFKRVRRGDPKKVVIRHIIDRTDGQFAHDTKLAEFLEASNKTLLSSTATLERMTAAWVEPINKN